ncbi:hypothetical protein GSI_09560 [Ganoderma sinense ZZ0214-1]|uniref:Uncharacterized protein n=1 Tax=Ganoderma sinense ZZ0214-1 TaxID=1077348 RepID=A0A2G8S3D9_9APHY|nr:hypothetical protein GSI_09560 [Ganoderma sinense ZZ0214-1]
MVATILIGCKAWEHKTIMAGVPSLKRSSRVEKILIFLVESGTIYSIIWVSILIYQVALLGESEVVSTLEEKMFNTFDYFVKGCLIPLIGMYPTIIITLVALNKSHFHGTSSGGGPISDISFRRPITTTLTSNQEHSFPTSVSWSRPQDGDSDSAPGVDEDLLLDTQPSTR